MTPSIAVCIWDCVIRKLIRSLTGYCGIQHTTLDDITFSYQAVGYQNDSEITSSVTCAL